MKAAILRDIRFDHCRGWIRRKINAGRSWDEVRFFLRPTQEQAEARLKEAIENGDIESLDSLEGNSLLDRWGQVVNVIEEEDRT